MAVPFHPSQLPCVAWVSARDKSSITFREGTTDRVLELDDLVGTDFPLSHRYLDAESNPALGGLDTTPYYSANSGYLLNGFRTIRCPENSWLGGQRRGWISSVQLEWENSSYFTLGLIPGADPYINAVYNFEEDPEFKSDQPVWWGGQLQYNTSGPLEWYFNWDNDNGRPGAWFDSKNGGHRGYGELIAPMFTSNDQLGFDSSSYHAFALVRFSPPSNLSRDSELRIDIDAPHITLPTIWGSNGYNEFEPELQIWDWDENDPTAPGQLVFRIPYWGRIIDEEYDGVAPFPETARFAFSRWNEWLLLEVENSGQDVVLRIDGVEKARLTRFQSRFGVLDINNDYIDPSTGTFIPEPGNYYDPHALFFFGCGTTSNRYGWALQDSQMTIAQRDTYSTTPAIAVDNEGDSIYSWGGTQIATPWSACGESGFAEWIHFRRRLQEDEAAKVRSFVMNRWGLLSQLPAGSAARSPYPLGPEIDTLDGFPDVRPSTRVYVPSSWSNSPYDSIGGVERSVRHSDSYVGDRLQLEFYFVSKAERDAIEAHYNARRTGFESFAIPPSLLVGLPGVNPELARRLSLFETAPPGCSWIYTVAPTILEQQPEIYNVTVELELVRERIGLSFPLEQPTVMAEVVGSSAVFVVNRILEPVAGTVEVVAPDSEVLDWDQLIGLVPASVEVEVPGELLKDWSLTASTGSIETTSDGSLAIDWPMEGGPGTVETTSEAELLYGQVISSLPFVQVTSPAELLRGWTIEAPASVTAVSDNALLKDFQLAGGPGAVAVESDNALLRGYPVEGSPGQVSVQASAELEVDRILDAPTATITATNGAGLSTP